MAGSIESSRPLSFIPQPQKPVVGTTLESHIMGGMRGARGATGEFTSLLNQISLAVRIIDSRVRAAGLADLLGYTGETNVQGESVQKLDVFANEAICAVLGRGGHCAMLASEEVDDVMETGPEGRAGKYVVMFDPLDGSSNIDVNISIGTIFGVLRRRNLEAAPTVDDALRPGREIVAAGYAVYGSSTVLVLTTGHGVHCFTLDPTIGEFFLSHADIKCPPKGNTFSTNEGNECRWSPEMKKWNQWIKSDDKAKGLPYGQRYVGSLVADAHRTLLKGGIFAYPADSKSPKGKLRLLYEANPIAFVFEQAGGLATNGVDPILDIKPESLHQRTPLTVGSKDDVETFRAFMRGER
jgi:fructose-1,6-bisphosphatase I